MQNKALVIQGLQKQYPNGLKALKGIDLSVNKGEFFGLLGPNGAGKSTTIGIVASLVNKTAGKVFVFDKDLDHDPALVRGSIGLVPQEFNFNIFEKVSDILTNQAGYYGIPYKQAYKRVEILLEKLGLSDKINQQARMLSGGLKRRLLIARGLIHEPPLLILDEPTAGVDIELRRTIWEFLKEINRSGTTIILTTHNLEEAENLCRQIAIINKGEIIENTSVKRLISQLHKETILLDVKSPVTKIPQIPDFEINVVDDHTLEVSFKRNHTLNQLFDALTHLGCEVVSFRNKTNRLEELFLDLVKKG